MVLACLLSKFIAGSGAAQPSCGPLVLELRNRGTSKRTSDNPLGEQKYPSVRAGNVLAMRTLIIVMICHALGCFWILEQPKGSVMEALPGFQQLLKRLDIWKHTLNMADYGAPSLKPTWLYASPLAHLQSCFGGARLSKYIMFIELVVTNMCGVYICIASPYRARSINKDIAQTYLVFTVVAAPCASLRRTVHRRAS